MKCHKYSNETIYKFSLKVVEFCLSTAEKMYPFNERCIQSFKKKQNAKQSIRIWLWVSVKIPTDTYWIKRFCGTGGTRSVGKPRFTGMTDYYHYSCCTIIYTDILILVFNYVVNETLLEKYKGLPSLFNKKVCFSIEFAQRTTFGRFLLSLIIVTNRSSESTIYTEWSLSL